MRVFRSEFAQFSGKDFTKRIVVPMASVMLVAITVVIAFVFLSARQQNNLEVEASTKLATTALQVKARGCPQPS